MSTRRLGNRAGALDVEDAVELLGILLLEESSNGLCRITDRVANLFLHGPYLMKIFLSAAM